MVAYYTSVGSTVLVTSYIRSCPDDFFRASNTTCLHIALPTSMGPKEWYCNTKGGELFGRPLTEDLQEALSNEIKAQSEKWMPPRTYTGMERNNNGYDMGKKSELWKFYDEDEIFHQSDYKVWNQEPTKGDDCAVVGLETEFKVEEENCLIAHGLLCNKNEFRKNISRYLFNGNLFLLICFLEDIYNKSLNIPVVFHCDYF
ncbi:UNVERIFIED_CONTAM: hypothetical protein NCL1_33066 [Trichonephila clavipes]